MSNPSLRYQVYYTTEDKTPIIVPRSSVVTDAGDVVFIGKNRLEYGEVFNTNTVHLLEHFAVDENPTTPDTPNLNSVIAPLLAEPTIGQIWYNKTRKVPYVWNGAYWISIERSDMVSGNSGVIFHGQQLPRPISESDGYTYPYTECSWVVSPFGFAETDRLSFLSCYTDSQARVNMQFRRVGAPGLTNGYATYQIIGIRNTINHGVPFPTPNVPGLTPTPTVTPTLTPTRTPMATLTMTPTRTRTPGPTRSATPTPTISSTATPQPTLTVTPTPTPTITPTITPTVTPSRIPQWSQIDEECELIAVEDATGEPCNPVPSQAGCSIGTIGTQVVLVSECFIGAGTVRRCTRTFVCTLQDVCYPP